METVALITTPVITSTEATDIACVSLVIPRAEMAQMLPRALDELFATLHAQHRTPTGAWFAHHTQLPTTHFHFRACVPIASPVIATGRVEADFFSPRTVAHTSYRGPYTHLPQAWSEFRAWTIAQQLPTATEVIERCTVNPAQTLNPAELLTELLWPLVAPRSS